MVAGDNQLRSFVERLKTLEQEKRDRAEDIKEVLKEAKSAGYDVKALRIVLKREMEDADQAEKRRLHETNVELMVASLGSFGDSPLGAAAIERAQHADA